MLTIGDVLNQTYRIEQLLGEGGMARVYLVSHTRLPKKFALKLIANPQVADGDFAQRFRREAEVLASLNHIHIVNVSDWNQTEEGLPYLIMEYLEGEDLAHFLSRTGGLQLPVALSILHQIGLALQAAHSAGIIHRDLKPGNIFLCKDGPFPNFVKVLDFGIAKLLCDAGPLKTSAQALMGTPAYMSPEQAKGNVGDIDARSDQFSLAVILYEMISGQRPFCLAPDQDMMSTIAHVIFHDPVPLALPQIGPAVQRAMQKDPAARFASIHDFVAATGARRAFGAAVSPATLNSTQGEVARAVVSRRGRRNVAVAVAGLAVAGLVGLWGSKLLVGGPAVSGGKPVAIAEPPVIRAAPASPTVAGSPPATVVPPVLPAIEAGIAPPASQSRVLARPAPKSPAGPPKSSETGPKTASSRSAGSGSAGGPASSSGPGAFEVFVVGASDAQQKPIKQCCITELKSLTGMPRTYKVVLQRSGTLHIVGAPDEVRQTDLGQCLRNAFPLGEAPAYVTVHVRGNR